MRYEIATRPTQTLWSSRNPTPFVHRITVEAEDREDVDRLVDSAYLTAGVEVRVRPVSEISNSKGI